MSRKLHCFGLLDLRHSSTSFDNFSVDNKVLFSLPGMPAWQAIYFADVFSLFFLVVILGATTSQKLLDRSSPTFQEWGLIF